MSAVKLEDKWMNKLFRFVQAAHDSGSNQDQTQRREAIGTILNALREREIARLASMVHHEKERQPTTLGDASDRAQMQQEMEMHVSLLWRSQNRLGVIWAALERLEEGHFGFCEECGEEISLERLGAVPMASYCVECQSRSENFRAAEVATTFTSFSFAPVEPRVSAEPTPEDEASARRNFRRLRKAQPAKAKKSPGVRKSTVHRR